MTDIKLAKILSKSHGSWPYGEIIQVLEQLLISHSDKCKLVQQVNAMKRLYRTLPKKISIKQQEMVKTQFRSLASLITKKPRST